MTIRKRIRTLLLEEHGFAELAPAGTYLPPHSCGMPDGWAVRLRTERRVCDGAHAIYVYPDRALFAMLRCPYNSHDWRIVEARPYETISELLAVVTELTAARVAACWS